MSSDDFTKIRVHVIQALMAETILAPVEHVMDRKEIGEFGIVRTPALMVRTNTSPSLGAVPSIKRIKELIQGARRGLK